MEKVKQVGIINAGVFHAENSQLKLEKSVYVNKQVYQVMKTLRNLQQNLTSTLPI